MKSTHMRQGLKNSKPFHTSIANTKPLIEVWRSKKLWGEVMTQRMPAIRLSSIIQATRPRRTFTTQTFPSSIQGNQASDNTKNNFKIRNQLSKKSKFQAGHPLLF